MKHHPVAAREIICSLHEPGWNYGYQRSPHYRENLANGATYVAYNRRLMPVSMKTSDRFEAYRALRRGVVRLDTGELPTEFRGPDSTRLLNMLLTRDVSRMRPGRCSYGIACWPDGGVLVDGILVRLEQDRYWYVQADGDFFGWAKAHALGMDVTVSDPQAWVYQVQGPESLGVLAAACDDGLPDPFRYFDAREVAIGGQRALITRTGWTGELGFEVYAGAEIDQSALWECVTKAGTGFGMMDIGLDGMDIRRIEAGILNNGSDIDSATSAWAAGFARFIDLSKEDFFGRQALVAADRRTRVCGIRCPTAEPLTGAPVTRDGTEIGHVTAAAWSPFLESGIGLARFASADLLEPSKVEITGFDLEAHAAAIVDLPFYDPEKRIPRGLEVANW